MCFFPCSPLRYIDPTGRDVTETAWGTSYTGVDAQNMFRQLQQQYGNGGGDDSDKKKKHKNNNSTHKAENKSNEKNQKELTNKVNEFVKNIMYPIFWTAN